MADPFSLDVKLPDGSTIPNPTPGLTGSSGDFNGTAGIFQWLRDQANKGNQDAIDKLVNYFLSEDSNNSARSWLAEREDTTYQRLAEDLKKAGFNPSVMFTGLSGGQASSASGTSYSGNYLGSSARNDENNLTKVLQKLFPALVSALAVAMMFA